jgi:autotransporter-associated beta strand protein
VLVLTLAAAVTAIPVAAQARPSRASARVIKLMSVSIRYIDHDVDPKGPSAGDWASSRTRLYNAVRQFGRAAGVLVGSDSGTMRLTGPRSATFRGTTNLPGGTLIVKGTIAFPAGGGLLFPVVGGTGNFAHAKGSVYVNGGKTRAINVYRLSFAGR